MKINLQLINTIALVGLIIFFIFKTERKSTNTSTHTIKELQTIINDTTIHLTTIKNRVQKVDLKPLEDMIDSLINARKLAVDTVVIVEVQERIIYVQSKEIDTLKTLVVNQDSIIGIQDFTSKVKDSIIEIQKVKVKKKNKTIFKLVLSSLALGGVAILE